MYTKTSSTGDGAGLVVNVTTDGSSTPTITIYHGGYGYLVDDTITLDLADTGTPGSVNFISSCFIRKQCCF
jgi:hypothetical protein